MLHIVLLILKILGIIILVILGLILLILLAILFVPVRYTLEADYHGKPTAKFRFSWLCSLLRFRGLYDKKIRIKGKVLFFTLYDSDKEEEAKESDSSKKHQNKKNSDKQSSHNREQNIFDDAPVKAQAIPQKTCEEITFSEDHTIIDQSSDQVESHNEKKKRKKKSLLQRIKKKVIDIYEKIRGFINKVITFIKSLAHKCEDTKNKILEKIQSIKDAIANPEYKQLASFLLKEVKLFIRKSKPRRYRINIRYGLGDPEQTGQVTIFVAVIYGLLGLDMNIIPDFENQVFEGDIYLKGRIRLYWVVLLLWRFYRNKLVKKYILK